MSRTIRQMLMVAAWCVIAFAVLLVLAYYVGPARWLDAAALHGFESASHPWIESVATFLAHLCDPFPYGLVAAAVIGTAAKTRGLRVAAAAGFLLVGANASSQILKPLLAHHREIYFTEFHLFNIKDAAFPSGHATAAMALSLAVLMIVPRAFRPLAATLGALFTIGVSFSILILGWHFPSDVVGGYLMATAWGLTTLAAYRYADNRWPQRGTMRVAARKAIAPSPPAIARAMVVLAAIACLAAASRADQIAGYAERHTATLAVASAIAVAAAVLLAAVASISSSRRNP